MKRKLDTRESIRVVTTNDFTVAPIFIEEGEIRIKGYENISLKARKLLYPVFDS